MQNFFLGATPDPLMGGGNYQLPNIDEKIEQLRQTQQQLEQYRQQVVQQQSQPQTPQSRTPLWDEIEKITSGMTEREFELINSNEEYQLSNQAIIGLIQREQMRIVRPIVENSKDGKDILDKHLALIKRLRKTASEEANKNLELFNEYTEHYSDMTYAEFLKMKRGGGKKK